MPSFFLAVAIAILQDSLRLSISSSGEDYLLESLCWNAKALLLRLMVGGQEIILRATVHPITNPSHPGSSHLGPIRSEQHAHCPLPDKKGLWYTCRKMSIFPKRQGLFVHSICTNLCLNVLSICAIFGLNVLSICANFGLNTHSPIYFFSC